MTKPHILVVEDETIVAMDIERGLKKLGYEVVGLASTGEQALKLAAESRPDLALMDIQLQGAMDGIETARLLRESAQVPVVFLTAYADEHTLERAKTAEPFGYLLKPFDDTELHTALEVALHKHQTERLALQRKEVALQLSEARFRLLVESLHDYAVFMLDPAGRIASWNPGAERTYGYQGTEVVGQHCSVLFPVEEVTANKPDRALMLATREGRHQEEGWRQRKDGSRFWGDVVTSAMYDDRGLCGFAKVVRDMTQRKAAEDEIHRLNAELEDRVRDRTAALLDANRELEAFTYSVAHDLRAPLRSIAGFSHALREDRGEVLGEAIEMVDRIESSAIRMTGLLDDLLAFSRASRAKVNAREVNLNALLDEIIADLGPELEKRNVQWQIAHLPTVRGDPVLLKQVMVNLLSNALKYTRPRETARIEVGYGSSREGDYLFVRDNGVGFDMARARQLFSPFTRLHDAREFEGTGLGLAIVDRIVRRHGGKAWAEAAPNQGATIFFTLNDSVRRVQGDGS